MGSWLSRFQISTRIWNVDVEMCPVASAREPLHDDRMSQPTVAAIVVAIIVAASAAQPAEAAEPLTSRCYTIPPICMPGARPVCICENDYSINCSWICAGN